MESIDVHVELVHFVEVMMAHTWRKGGGGGGGGNWQELIAGC